MRRQLPLPVGLDERSGRHLGPLSEGRASVHPVAAGGFHGEVYERGRPDYPPDAVDALGLEPGSRVLDLGAGTGKLTRLLRVRHVEATAIDPAVDMLLTLRRLEPDVPAAAGTAESVPLRSGSMDAAVCASAFHWFATDEALDEIHRVLRPNGRLGLLWNRRDLEVGWVSRLWGELVEPLRGEVPAHDSHQWRHVLDASPLFGPVTEHVFGHAQPCDADTLIARLDSTSFVNVLPADEKAELFERVRRFCTTDRDLAGRATFAIPYRTFVYACRRTGAG